MHSENHIANDCFISGIVNLNHSNECRTTSKNITFMLMTAQTRY